MYIHYSSELTLLVTALQPLFRANVCCLERDGILTVNLARPLQMVFIVHCPAQRINIPG